MRKQRRPSRVASKLDTDLRRALGDMLHRGWAGTADVEMLQSIAGNAAAAIGTQSLARHAIAWAGEQSAGKGGPAPS